MRTSTADLAPGVRPSQLMLELALPVHDEAKTLEFSLRRLHAYLSQHFPFSWRLAIVDNASTDDTLAIGRRVAEELGGIRVLHLDRKGRGSALRAAWLTSDATVVAYTDIDLSTGLDALLPLIAPLLSGHSDVAIGSRLLSAANVARGPKREMIFRAYNLILRATFSTRVHDAQCGFKALRADVAQQLVPAVVDDGWFFDTELGLAGWIRRCAAAVGPSRRRSSFRCRCAGAPRCT